MLLYIGIKLKRLSWLVFYAEMYRYIDNTVRLNVNEMFDEAIRATRIDMSPAERKQFFSQFIKTMHMTIAENGDVVLEFKRK